MIKQILVLLSLVATLNYAQETYGPVNTDYRMKLWENWSGLDFYEGVLQSPSSNIDIGKEYQYRINRIAYQWDIDYSDIPQDARIEQVQITYKYTYVQAEAELPLFIYELYENLSDGSPDVDKLYLGMSGTSSAHGQKISESHEQPNQLVTFETTGYNIATWRDVIAAALAKGKLVLGFRSSVEDWENSPNRNYRINSAEVTLKIEFTTQTRDIVLNQKLNNGMSVGVIKHWEGDRWSDDITPGSSFTVTEGDIEVFLGDQNIYSNQKYNNWNDDLNDVQNFRTFVIDEYTTGIQSNFKPTSSGITIETSLEGTTENGGKIQFFDPWLIDYSDPTYDYQLRNRGNSADFKTQNSPFTPDYTSLYNGNKYRGLFPNQEFIDGTFYKVMVPLTQDVNLGGQIGTRKFYFQNWKVIEATLQNPNSNETGVTFNQDNSQVQAVFKGTDLTDDVYAIRNNNQSKIIRIGSGANDDLYKVYESLDCVWLEKSTNNGVSWELMNDGKPHQHFL
ncbi:MAG: hypothetical protein PHW27_07230 [Melioribacteraceae bacterium]|nr:hypothetical protein [Melioribacteraceae bacterium]